MSGFHLTPDALASLRDIACYTQERWGEDQRRVYLKTLDDTFYMLAGNPRCGKPRPSLHHGLRSYPQGRHVVYYLTRSDHIVIVNILHERMDPERHLLSPLP